MNFSAFKKGMMMETSRLLLIQNPTFRLGVIEGGTAARNAQFRTYHRLNGCRHQLLILRATIKEEGTQLLASRFEREARFHSGSGLPSQLTTPSLIIQNTPE